MQTIEQLLYKVLKLQEEAAEPYSKGAVLALTAEDEQTLIIAEWKKNPAKANPSVRSLYATFAGCTTAWDSTSTMLLPAGGAKAAAPTAKAPTSASKVSAPAPKVPAIKGYAAKVQAQNAPTPAAPAPAPTPALPAPAPARRGRPAKKTRAK